MLIGEIRDEETAKLAVRAALTGHLVLSTLHSNSAIAALARLKDLGVSPYLMSTSLKGILAQRLIRSSAASANRGRPLTRNCSGGSILIQPVNIIGRAGAAIVRTPGISAGTPSPRSSP